MFHQTLLPPGLKKIITGLLICFFIVAFIACNNDKKADEKTVSTDSATVAASTFKMNCIILDSAQIQAWVDSGWTKPGTGELMKKILLQFYTPDASNADNNMQLMAFPGKSYTSIYSNAKVFLAIDATCTALTLSGPVSLSNNYIDFAKLGITKANGDLEPFNFIRLRPVMSYPPYINFEIQVVRISEKGEETIMAKGGTDPCPTICP